MNLFTKYSIELANQRDYLDQLYRVYPLAPDSIRTINKDLWNQIEDSYNTQDNLSLINALLQLKLFPIKDSYVAFLRKDKNAIYRNPRTVNRICGRVRELGLDRLYERITEPKETNRQIGPMFRQWVESGVLGVPALTIESFKSTQEDAILIGSDSLLMEFAAQELGVYRNDNKGFDFLGRFNKKYVIGEAKFLTDEGGHQNDQFLDAMVTLRLKTPNNVNTVAILDGVLYIQSKKKIFRAITNENVNVMSALLLRDYLFSI